MALQGIILSWQGTDDIKGSELRDTLQTSVDGQSVGASPYDSKNIQFISSNDSSSGNCEINATFLMASSAARTTVFNDFEIKRAESAIALIEVPGSVSVEEYECGHSDDPRTPNHQPQAGRDRHVVARNPRSSGVGFGGGRFEENKIGQTPTVIDHAVDELADIHS